MTRRFLVIVTAIGFVALIAIVAAAAWLNVRSADHARWVNHTYAVETSVAKLQSTIELAETSRRGYLLTATPSYLTTQLDAAARVDPQFAALAGLTADNPRQRDHLAALRTLLRELDARQGRSVALMRQGKEAEARQWFAAETPSRLMRAVRLRLRAMLDDEQRLLVERDQQQRASVRAFYFVLGGAGALIVLLALATLATVMRYTRDLTTARDRLQQLNADLEGAVKERTADLTRANEEIQRYAYIVSHDLRSPLVNVMGFTSELEEANKVLTAMVDTVERRAPGIDVKEAANAVREELPEAIGFIRTSTQKMDRLINAILRLSREGRRVLTNEPLDLGEIARNIRDSLRHLADDRGAEIVVQDPLPTLIGDRVAIEQMLSNLVENAVKYLSPDRPGLIIVRGETRADRAIIEVADNGRGIAPADHARIFDLFRRSGPQDQPGEGIGLAHVRAFIQRLGGTIDVQSTLGEGSVFRINIPSTPSETGPTP